MPSPNRILLLGTAQALSAITSALPPRRRQVTHVTDTQAAISACADRAFDLILVEGDATGGRDNDLYGALRILSRSAPVLVLLATGDSTVKEACRQAGAAQVIVPAGGGWGALGPTLSAALKADPFRGAPGVSARARAAQPPGLSHPTERGSARPGSFEVSADLRTWTCSPEVYGMLEREPASGTLTFQQFLRALNPSDRKAVRAAMLHAMRDGATFQLELRVQSGEFSDKLVQMAARPVQDEQGAVRSFIGLLTDISHHKSVEQALRASELRYQGLFEDAPIVISEQDFSGVKGYLEELRSREHITDIRAYLRDHPEVVVACLDRLRICDINQAGLDLFGAREKQEVIENHKRIVRDEGLPLFEEELVRIFNGEQHFVLEGVNYTLDGRPLDIQLRWIEASGGRNHLSNVIISITDISERNKMTRKLVQSENKFRTIVQQSLDGVVITDNQGVIREWNQGMERMSGLMREEVIGRLSWEVQYQQMMDDARQATTLEQERNRIMDYLANAEDPWYGKMIEHPIQKPDGSRRMIQSVFFPIQAGGEHMTVNISRDVTESLEARQRLDQAQERFRLVSENITDLVLLIKTNGMISYASPSFRKMLGYQPQEIIGRHVLEFILSEDAARVEDYFFPRVLQDSQMERIEFKAVHKDGRHVWLETSAQPVRNPDGSVEFVVASSRDVTERKKNEQDLQSAQRQLANRIAELELLTQELNLLTEMTNMLQICASPQEAVSVVAQSAGDLFPGLTGVFYTSIEENGAFKASASWGNFTGARIMEHKDCWGLRRRRIHTTHPLHSNLYCTHIGLPQPSSSICVPVLSSGRPIALLSLQTDPGTLGLTIAQQKLAAATAEQIGLALSNLNLRQNLRELAIRDSLTGLYNRHYLEESLENEMRRAQRNGKPIGLIMLDLDGFKMLNSRYGHPTVDQMLREFGVMLKGAVRSGDIACRYGGDEFLLILPETTLAVAQQRAEEIRGQIKTLAITPKKDAPQHISASIGVACWPQHGETSQAVLSAVDEALFEAKKAGGDQVSTAA